jgi:hypothetical protein
LNSGGISVEFGGGSDLLAYSVTVFETTGGYHDHLWGAYASARLSSRYPHLTSELPSQLNETAFLEVPGSLARFANTVESVAGRTCLVCSSQARLLDSD